MADIFISYKQEDRSWAEAIAIGLEAQGWSVWWDVSLQAEKSFDEVIERELDLARCVVVLWSEASVNSRRVRAEAGEGLEREILVPVFIEQVRPPLVFQRIHTKSLVQWKKSHEEHPFVELVNDIHHVLAPVVIQEHGMEFVLIKPVPFQMGSTNGRDNEKPVHNVILTNSFYLGIHPVTQGQYCAITGTNPSHFSTVEAYPVERVSWHDAQSFIERLNEKEHRYRLPSEAEWECACRAGTTTVYSFGDDARKLNDSAWTSENSGRKTHPVGRKQANPWGLYDMYGNVWEWVQDWYGAYPDSTLTDPTGPETGSNRVIRGGSWGNTARYSRSAYRRGFRPDSRYSDVGFRVVRT